MTVEIVAQAAVSGILMGFVYALIAAGLSLIFGLMELVNFAHGEFLMLAMYVAFFAWALGGLDPLLALPLCALGLAAFLRSAAQFFWGVDFRVVTDPWLGGRISLAGVFIGLPQLTASLAALL